MKNRLSRRAMACALYTTVAHCGLTTQPAAAQTKIITFPAEKFEMTPGGVDMRTHRYVYSNTDLAIGPADGAGALKLVRIMPDYAGSHINPFGNFAHNWDIWLLETRRDVDNLGSVQDYRMTLHVGGRSFTFDSPENAVGYGYKSDGPTAELTFSGGTKSSSTVAYTATTPDGVVLNFRDMGKYDCAPSGRRCAYVADMTEPDGTKYSFSYDYNSSATGHRARLKQVVSNRGYALLLEGNGSNVTKACVLNLAVAPVPSTGVCPSSAPTTSYSYVTGVQQLSSVTAADQSVSQFSYTPLTSNTFEMGFIKPGQSAPWLTNSIRLGTDEEDGLQEMVTSQSFADGRVFTYTTDVQLFAQGPFPGGTITDVAGKTIKIEYDYPVAPGDNCTGMECPLPQWGEIKDKVRQRTPGPVLIEDQLGRQTVASYCTWYTGDNGGCSVGPMWWFTDPEGIRTDLQYDAERNVTKVTRNPKSGSTLPAIVTEAAYDITNSKAQTKPLWIKDGKGNVTNYEYDPSHGGLLKETGPAVNGISPQKRFGYTQRHAWISNGSGGFTQAATPVWLLTSESFCRTKAWNGTSCSSVSSDEVITTYDYGPNSGPNNLLLRGTVVTADGVSRRTCFKYDAQGSRIAETRPRAGLTSCP